MRSRSVSSSSGTSAPTARVTDVARQHLSIGEVLTLLQVDFPDVSISKIRFLESQGLIAPERTPSGYRKFYEVDIDRLRWILTEQRDNFLPLRVIREKLAKGEDKVDPDESEVDDAANHQPRETAGAASTDSDDAAVLDAGPTSLTLTAEELASATGLSSDELDSLETYGLIRSRSLGPATYYDGEALAVAKMASGFKVFGVEARHLRMFRTAAEREAAVYEQVVMPLVKQRNPTAQSLSREQLEEMARLGGQLRAAMIRQALRPHIS